MKEYVVTRAGLVGRCETHADKYDMPEGPTVADAWRTYWVVCAALERTKYETKEQQHTLQGLSKFNLSTTLPPSSGVFNTRSVYSLDGVVVLNDLQEHFGSGTHSIIVASQDQQTNEQIQRDLQRQDPCLWQTQDYWAKEEPTNASIVGMPERHYPEKYFKTGYFDYLRQHAPDDISCNNNEVRDFFYEAAQVYARAHRHVIKDLEVFKQLDERFVSEKIKTHKDSVYDLREVSV